MKTKSTQAEAATSNETVEVLYQKLGDRWFAFSLIDDEVFFGSIDPQSIQNEAAANPGTGVSRPRKLAGNV
jgi:hypothetical protein